MIEDAVKMEDFYTICSVRKDEGSYTYEISLNPAHELYKGHFPDMPVVPGVCMLQIIRECVSHAMDRRLRYVFIRSCKFLAVVNPAEKKRLVLTFSIDETNHIQAMAMVDGEPVLKLKAELTQG